MPTPPPDSPAPFAGRPVVVACISYRGVVLDVTGPFSDAWPWTPGETIPEHLSIALEPVLPGDTAELPFVEGGLIVRVTASEDGWTLNGYPSSAERANGASSEARTAFIATLSHEIRTPLGSVHGFANLLRREIDDIERHSGIRLPEQIREFADAISAESGRLLAIVNDLFDHASLESGRFDIRSGSADLGAHLESAMGRIRPELARKGVQLARARIDSNLMVGADPARIDRILDGLLSNAAKFTHEGSVVVSARAEKSTAVVEITDTGIGISESYQANLFEAFSQEEDWRVRMHGGAGLGLALISRTLDLMGGRIEVTSRKGYGSTFTVHIPLATASADGTAHTPVTTPVAGSAADAAAPFSTEEEGADRSVTPGDGSAHFQVRSGRSV